MGGTIIYSIEFDAKEAKVRIWDQIDKFLEYSNLDADINDEVKEIKQSLYHKFVIFKYHLICYRNLESSYKKKLTKKYEKMTSKTGQSPQRYLIEFPDLTAHYESLLFQSKATLDILIKLLNPLYRNCHPILKQLKTFENKGEGVLKDLTKFSERSGRGVKTKIDRVIKLLEKEKESIDWLDRLINARDTISHYRKNEVFAFQIDIKYSPKGDKELSVIPPRETEDQTIREFLGILRYNLLTFCEDFIAVSLAPFLDKALNSYSFKNCSNNPIYFPKWYIWPKDLPCSPKQIMLPAYMGFITQGPISRIGARPLLDLFGYYSKYDIRCKG